jgi:peptide/nickel transport system substrate-binding protein
MANKNQDSLSLSRRRLLQGAGAVLGAATIAPWAGVAFAQEGDVLKIIHGAFDMNWSPLQGGGPPLRWQSLWWASPMYFDGEANIHPYVFTEWASNADATVWTFKLNPAATFSDGGPITVEDVKGSWEVAAMPLTGHYRIDQVLSGVVGYDEVLAGSTKELTGIKAVDPQTIEVTLKQPDPVFFMRIANQLAPIVRASEARDADGNQVTEWFYPQNGGVSSGPFKLVEINLDAGTLAFEVNEHFFGPKPKLRRIEVRVVEDAVTATAMLQAGEYQAHTELVTSTIIQDLGAEFSQGPAVPSGQHFWFNVNTAPFNDPKVREALILAVDRKQVMQASFPNGPYPQADQILVGVAGAENSGFEPYPFDPDRARQLLAESSYGGAERLPKLVMVGIGFPAVQVAAQNIVEQWRQNLGISAVEMRPALDSYSLNDVHVTRDDAGTRVPDAATYLNAVIHTGAGTAVAKMNGYSNAEVDRLLDEASTKAADDPQRIALAQQAQVAFRNDFAFLPWYHEIMPRWAVPAVAGMGKNLDWQVAEPWNIEIKKS